MQLFYTRRRRVMSAGGALGLLLVLVICLAAVARPATTLAASSAGTTRVLSTDPYSNPTSQHHTEVEPDTYSFGSMEVSAYQAGRFFTGGGSTNIGWAVSH